MLHWMTPFFGNNLVPHEHCYLWQPELVGLHLLSDALATLASYSIPLILFYFVRKRQAFPFTWLSVPFSVAIVAYGTMHLMEIWTLWYPLYWLSSAIKLTTVAVSLLTAVLLGAIVTQALVLPGSSQLETANQALQREIVDRQYAEAALQKSEARVQTLVKNIPGMLYRYVPREDGAGIFTYASPGSYGLLELEPDHILQDANAVWALFQPEDLLSLQASVAAAVQHCTFWQWEGQLTTPSGELKWIQGSSRPEQTPDGVVWDGLLMDITARKQAEQSLQEREAFLRAIGDNIPNGYLYQLLREPDGRYRYTYVSAGVERVSGLQPEAILADSSLMFGLVVEADLPYILQKGEESAQNLSVFEVQVRERLSNGEIRWLQLCSMPRWLDDGRLVWDGIRLDINDLKQTEESLRQSEERWHLAISGSNDGIWDHNLQTNAHYLSPRCLEILGYEYNEIATFDRWLQQIHPDDIDRLQTTFQAHVEHRLPNYACEYRIKCKDGSYKWLLSRGQVLWDAEGHPLRAVGSLTDISDRKRVEDERQEIEIALRQSEAKNRAMLAAIPDLLLRLKRDGTCLETISPRAAKTGEFFLIDKNISEILPPALLQHQLQRIEQALTTGELQVWEQQFLKHGKLCDEETRLIPCGDDEVLVIVRNISERKQAEESLRRYERIVSTTTDAIALLDRNYVYQVVNQTYLNWYNKRQDEVVGHRVSDLVPSDLYEAILKPKLDQCLAGQVVQYETWVDFVPLGSQFLSVTYNPYFDASQTFAGVVVSLRNRTQLKQAEVALELQSIVVRNMAEGVCMVKVSDGLFVYTNPKFERMFGYDADELIGQPVAIVNYEDKTTNTTAIFETLAREILAQGEATHEIHNVKKDGTPFWCRATTSVFEHPHYGAVFVVVQQDITERKHAAEQLEASLREKEVLLKEIHHRVKNNLGVVDGLLQMQSRRSQNPDVIETLKESQNRIASIALVHEKLYGSNDLAAIDFTQYIADLTAHLFNSYNIQPNQVQLTTQIDQLTLDIDTAIPCGLIINELVSNALKYAFPERRLGAIQVTLQQQHDHSLILIVRDNGVGLARDFNLKQTQTLGMTLVKGLVKQLKGTLEAHTQLGAMFVVSFYRT